VGAGDDVPDGDVRRYGASPLHLLAHLALLPLCAWALLQVADARRAENIVLWLVAAVVLHDLLLLPAYSLLDRVAARPLGGAINYVRVPAGLSLLLLLVFYGTISGRGERAFHRASGLTYDGYLGRWLLATGVLFALSGALYLLRTRAAARAARPRRTRGPGARSAT
jgi:hypothetical protein